MTAPADEPRLDLHTLRTVPFPERLRLIIRSWALQQNPTPKIVYLGYVLKIALLYVGGWWFFSWFSPDATLLSATAFQKAVLWSLAYEGLGFGCSTGPMTGRFV